MEPSTPQFEPQLGLPEKPRPVTLSELSPDPTTGRYTATKPGNVKEVDTKAEIAQIRADNTKEAEASAGVKSFVESHAAQIGHMRRTTKSARRRAGYNY